MKFEIIKLGIILLCWPLFLNGQTTYNNWDDFEAAITSAVSGDEIILAEGSYTGESITLTGINGTEESPIIIRAENIGKDTLNDDTYIDFRNCSYITIQGFVINISNKSTTFKVQASNNIRITQNVFNGENEAYYAEQEEGEELERNSSVWISIQGIWDDDVTLSNNNRIDHNMFMNKHTLGNMIRIDGTAELYVSQYDVIEFNHFMNMGPRADNEMEAIRVGWSAMSESSGYTTVSNNLFEECNGDPEIISIKCNDNTVSHNTFRRCEGTLSLRHGNRTVVEGNFFFGEGAEGTGGVRIYGSDHVIINNYFEGLTGTKWDAPITLTEGDAEEGSTGLTSHFRIERALIANNTLINNDYGIEVGYDNNGSYSKPPRDVVMAYNVIVGDTSAFVSYLNEPDNMNWMGNIALATDYATLGSGVTFTSDEMEELDPQLVLDSELEFYKATASSPTLTLSSEISDDVVYDIEGQLRSGTTNYGADEFSTSTTNYSPLDADDVGPEVGEYLYVSSAALSFLVAGGDNAISVQSNLDWDVQEDSDWFSVSSTNGSGFESFTVSTLENTTGLDRTDTIEVATTNDSEGTITRQVVISQLGVDPAILTVSETELFFLNTEDSEFFKITSNTSWIVSSNQSWTSIDVASGSDNSTVAVTVEANLLLTSRSAEITVTDGDAITEVIAIYQDAFVGTEIKLSVIEAIASTEQNETGKVNVAGNVLDEDFDTRWSGEGDGAYITLELESESNVSFVKVGLYNGESRTSSFDVQLSKDGEYFVDVLTDVTSELTTEDLVLYDFENDTAKYVRVVGHGNSTSDWNSYTEFEVWGWEYLDTLANADLTDILIGSESISGFNKNTLSYTFEVPYGTSSVIPEVTATLRVDSADVEITQATEIPGYASISVTSFDESVVKIYEIYFVEEYLSDDTDLSEITIGGVLLEGFESSILDYTVGLASGTTDIPVVDATVAYSGSEKVITQAATIGESAFIVVTAENQLATKTYSVLFVEEEESLSNFVLTDDVVVYPNPSNGIFRISHVKGAKLTVMNSTGKVEIQQEIVTDNEFVSDGLPKGIYLVRIEFTNDTMIKKVVVQ